MYLTYWHYNGPDENPILLGELSLSVIQDYDKSARADKRLPFETREHGEGAFQAVYLPRSLAPAPRQKHRDEEDEEEEKSSRSTSRPGT